MMLTSYLIRLLENFLITVVIKNNKVEISNISKTINEIIQNQNILQICFKFCQCFNQVFNIITPLIIISKISK